jgi:hypothetical protein
MAERLSTTEGVIARLDRAIVRLQARSVQGASPLQVNSGL